MTYPSLEVDGICAPVFCRRSPRARRLQLQVVPEGVWLVLPRHGGDDEAPDFLLRHARWAVHRCRELRAARAVAPVPVDGARLPWRGGELQLAVVVQEWPSAPGPVAFDRERRRLVVMAAQPAAVPGLLQRWYREQAASLATELWRGWAARVGAHPRTVRLRNLRSRWGSCSATGAISLNWRLILAPDPVFEYVVAHELCHLRHVGHGNDFWTELHGWLPDAARSRHWLRVNQTWMMSFLHLSAGDATVAAPGTEREEP